MPISLNAKCLIAAATLALLAQGAGADPLRIRPGQYLPALRTLAYRSGTNGAPAQFTFHVPVQLTYQTPGSEIAVGCEVGSGPASFFGFKAIGGGYTVVHAQPDGSYRGTVTLAFSAEKGDDPTEASQYFCFAMPGPSDTASVTATSAYGPLTSTSGLPPIRFR